MPRKPKGACHYRGCPRLTNGYYCDEHRKLMHRQYDKYSRNPESKGRYGYRWRKIRSAVLVRQPFCAECHKQGRLTLATEVHHILPLGDGGTNDWENLMPLCKSCHSSITVATKWNGRG